MKTKLICTPIVLAITALVASPAFAQIEGEEIYTDTKVDVMAEATPLPQ